MVEENCWCCKQIQFDMEMEGLILEYGDLIGILYDFLFWGQSGEVLVLFGLCNIVEGLFVMIYLIEIDDSFDGVVWVV